MDTSSKPTSNTKKYQAGMVHFILSNSYTIFFLAIVFGILLDMIIPVIAFNTHLYQYIGSIFIIVGTILAYWAQSTSRHSKEDMKNGTKRDFMRGPYKYSRNPTHIGLTLLSLGLGFVMGSLYIVVFSIIASLITKFIFLKKEESLLEEEYGQDYLDYKKVVKTWI